MLILQEFLTRYTYAGILAALLLGSMGVPIPEELVPADAKVEMEAKKAAGYFTTGKVASKEELTEVKGRALDV